MQKSLKRRWRQTIRGGSGVGRIELDLPGISDSDRAVEAAVGGQGEAELFRRAKKAWTKVTRNWRGVVRGDEAVEVEVDWLKKSFEPALEVREDVSRRDTDAGAGRRAMRVGRIGALDVPLRAGGNNGR